MKTWITALVVVGALVSAGAQAAGPLVECKATAFPYKRVQKKQDFKRLFDRLDREALTQYLFAEVTQPKGPGVADHLLAYLAGTEQNDDLRGFFELVRWGAEVSDDKSVPKKINLAEICEYYRKASAPGK